MARTMSPLLWSCLATLLKASRKLRKQGLPLLHLGTATIYIPDIPIKIEKVDIAGYPFAQHIGRDGLPIKPATETLLAAVLSI